MYKVTSAKGRTNITKEQFVYRSVGEMKNGEERWRCCKNNCTAKLYTLQDGNLFSRQEGQHNHDPKGNNLIIRQVISNSLKRKARETIGERPSKLVNNEVSKNQEALSTLTRRDVTRIKNNLVKARLKEFPKLPQTRGEVQRALAEMQIKTAKDEEFLLKNDFLSETVIFSCDTNLKHLSECEIWFMDGTFKYSTKHFTQLFTVHGLSNATYVPLVFCLLPDKTSSTYKQALTFIKEACNERNLALQPSKIVVDFEQAIHHAIRESFTSASIVGCRFHLGQSWWRKIQQLGLASAYKNSESEEGRWLTYCFGLPYVSPEDVDEVFCNLISIQPENEKLTKFADYMIETYVDRNVAIFPPTIWAAASAELWRSTNACGSFHARFNMGCASPHPNIFVFLNCLGSAQVDSYLRINSAAQNESVSQRKNTLLRKTFISRKLQQVANLEMDLLSFVKCVGHKGFQ